MTVWTGRIVDIQPPLFSAALRRRADDTAIVANFRLADLRRLREPWVGAVVKLFVPADADRDRCLLTQLACYGPMFSTDELDCIRRCARQRAERAV